MLQALRTRTNLVLLAVLLVVLTVLILVMTIGSKAVGVSSTGDAEQGRIDAVKSAVTQEVVQLFTFDPDHIQQWSDAVTAGATGQYLEVLQSQVETTKATIYQGKVVGTGSVAAVGINDLTATTATTFVQAQQNLSGPVLKDIPATATCPAKTTCRPVVLEVDVVLTPSGWKVSKLELVS